MSAAPGRADGARDEGAQNGRVLAIVTPAPRGSRHGNRTTALRWAGLLRQLGLRPFVATGWDGRAARALVAVHAQKSAPAVLAFAARRPHRRIAVLLAGTDVYPEFRPDEAMAQCLAAAHVLVALQPRTIELLPPPLRSRSMVILQSARPVPGPRPAWTGSGPFAVCVLAHLRPVKDPLLPFEAARLAPAAARLRVSLAGRALDPQLAARAAAEQGPDRRWVGERTRRQARELLRDSHVCVVPSRGEGGANVVSEAIAAGTPVLASAIPGNTGLLGDDWPGLFPAGDAAALAALLTRAATDAAFYGELLARTVALQPSVDPRRERAALQQLARTLGLDLPGPSPG